VFAASRDEKQHFAPPPSPPPLPDSTVLTYGWSEVESEDIQSIVLDLGMDMTKVRNTTLCLFGLFFILLSDLAVVGISSCVVYWIVIGVYFSLFSVSDLMTCMFDHRLGLEGMMHLAQSSSLWLGDPAMWVSW